MASLRKYSARTRGAGALAILAAGFWALWYNEHRTIGWGETFNPVYWYHRWRGDDLYAADSALLLHGNRSLREIAVTFDDGPHGESCGRILDVLKRCGARATFFNVGICMEQRPDLLRRMLAEGHEVANHTQNHHRLDRLSPARRHREINDADITYYRLTGRHLYLIRPPGMRYTEDVLAAARAMGYITVGFTTASGDFNPGETADFIVNRTLRRTENGSLILLHDYPRTAAALPRILATLQRRGYRFVTISEMIGHLPERQRSAAQALFPHDPAPKSRQVFQPDRDDAAAVIQFPKPDRPMARKARPEPVDALAADPGT